MESFNTESLRNLIESKVEDFVIEDGELIKINMNKAELTEVVIPEEVTEISSYVFNCCENLKSVKLPEGLRAIHLGAFMNCKSLNGIDLPEGLEYIGEIAFSHCESLERISFPHSLYGIGKDAFFGCNVLEEVVFNGGYTELKRGAFRNCKALSRVVMPIELKENWRGFSDCKDIEYIYTVEGIVPDEEDPFREERRRYRIRRDVVDYVDDSNDIGSYHVYRNDSYIVEYIPSAMDTVVRNGKIEGFRVSYKGESGVLYTDGPRRLTMGTDSCNGCDECRFMLREIDTAH